MKFPFLLYFSLLISAANLQHAHCQKRRDAAISQITINHITDSIFGKLVQFRRDMHANPELAGNEIRTQKKLKQYLLAIGLEVDTNSYGHGIVGILKGARKGKKIAWRAEMDALPNDFPETVDFRSTIKGVQHGCGHDVHMAIALGIAEALAKDKALLEGTLYFIFQPEEESFIGAKGMIDGGLFARIQPDEIYGLHVTALPAGQIMVKPNEIFAYQKTIRIRLQNKLTNDQVNDLVSKIQNKLSRAKTGNKPLELQYIADSDIGLANTKTIFKNYLIIDKDFTTYTNNNERVLEANLYETNAANLKKIIPSIEQIIKGNQYQKLLLSISFIQGNPTVMNDKKLTTFAVKLLNNIYGKGFVVKDYGQVPFFNDDFSYFQQKIPGVYFLLGGSNLQKGINAMNHAPGFMVDEECIRTAVTCFSSLIFERIKAR